MKHETAIAAVMKTFYSQDVTLPEALARIETIKSDLQAVVEKYQAADDDYRLGDATYGYEPEDVLGNLFYISDRWKAGFRVAWMLGLVDENYGPGQKAICLAPRCAPKEDRLALARQTVKDALDKCSALGVRVFDVDYREGGGFAEVEYDNLGFEITREDVNPTS